MELNANNFVYAVEDQRKAIIHVNRLMEIYNRKPANEKTRGYIEGLLKTLAQVNAQVEERHGAIVDYIYNESISESDVPYLQEGKLYDFMEAYLNAEGKLLDALEALNVRTNMSSIDNTSFHGAANSTRSEMVQSKVRLPQIELPKFSGDYVNWITFRDLFTSLVDKNLSLTKTQKFYFLRSACSSTPLEIIDEYPVAETSYDLAWQALKDRYNNKRKMVEVVLNKLLSIPASDGSVASVKRLLDTTKNTLALLTSMEVDNWEALLVHLTVTKLDKQTHKEWEQSLKATTELPSKDKLFAFLETTFRTLESVEDHEKLKAETSKSKAPRPNSASKSSNSGKQTASKQKSKAVHVAAAESEGDCPCCGKRHLLFKCFKFSSQPDSAKRELIKSKSLCNNCLQPGHWAKDCSVKSKCQECQALHHSSIHGLFCTKLVNQPSTSKAVDSEEKSKVSVHAVAAFPQVFLGTLLVNVRSKGIEHKLRALLDPGSQASLISEDAAQMLGLSKYTVNVPITGVGKTAAFTATKGVRFTVLSSYDKDYHLDCNALVLPKLTSYQPPSVDRTNLPNLDGFFLADPHFDKVGRVQLILGADVCGNILKPQNKEFARSIFLQLTSFGWVVSGPTPQPPPQQTVSINICSLDDQLRAFWEQEELIEKRKLSTEEMACEQHFVDTHSRDESGRYTVELPFKALLSGKTLPSFSYTDYSALRRFKQLENRFKSNSTFEAAYKEFMREYEDLGHMYKQGTYPRDLEKGSYFLPHHGVLRESSTTTKLRVVFDGSSKSQHGLSLNEELSPGPALQNDLPTIITRWRRFEIGFRSDLEKMFRQIVVAPEHHKFQQILWRHSDDEDIGIYRLSTVTYGTACAPYLSIRILQQLSIDEYKRFPGACEVLRLDTYVDDIISGADTASEAIELQRNLCHLLSTGGFNLRKWISNSYELMAAIPEHARDISGTSAFEENDSVKALGLEWHINSDTFSFKVTPFQKRPITKRSLLSDAARLYDPLGWLAPTTIYAKLTFQQLWLLDLDWGDLLPADIQVGWKNYQNGLAALEDIRIPRWLGGKSLAAIEIFGFCDASTAAYAAVAYARVSTEKGNFVVRLLQSKTKVAPLKTLTVPRLELCGAVLLIKLIDSIISKSEMQISSVRLFTDSTTVLAWIHTPASKLSVFVSNRVAEIQRRSNPSQWAYISTKENPADCASRGISAAELRDHPLWWTGPSWLAQEDSHWPVQPELNLCTDMELRKTKIAVHAVNKHDNVYPEILTRFSSLQRLVRVSAYILRFQFNVRIKALRSKLRTRRRTQTLHFRSGVLHSSELKEALYALIRISQHAESQEEIQRLLDKRPLPGSSSFCRLSPLLDQNGILRVGGRIKNAEANYDFKHPIILRKSNPLSLLIFTEAHAKTLHGGLQLMLSYVARQYWVIGARNLAKRVIRGCMTCFRYSAQAATQLMGDLPAVRVKPARAFLNTGVDYAGPVIIKQSTARNAITTKGYIAVFICMVTKAIHLEAVPDLSTNEFLMAFRRFTARRGHCAHLYSDCGTNFVGASKELQIIYNRSKASLPETLMEQLANCGTEWHFIPPAAPHFGGLWEAGVKSAKYHLRRLVQSRVLTFVELCTFLAEIESILNSRPLCPLSTDPSDCSALTPAHFLIGEPTKCIPDECYLDSNIDRLSRWKVVEKLKQHFWKRWVNEYLCRLQSRPKWLEESRDANVGDLVIVIDERCSPAQWPLGRVHATHPGSDNKVRVVSVLCGGKIIKRPLAKLAFLPTRDQIDWQSAEPAVDTLSEL